MSDVIQVTGTNPSTSIEYNYDTGAIEVIMYEGEEEPVFVTFKNLTQWDNFAAAVSRAHLCFHSNLDNPTWDEHAVSDHDDSCGGTME